MAGVSSVLGNVGMATKEGVLGTANAPIHMVAAEGGLKAQAWRTFRTLALGFLLLSGVGALIEDRGIGKGKESRSPTFPTLHPFICFKLQLCTLPGATSLQVLISVGSSDVKYVFCCLGCSWFQQGLRVLRNFGCVRVLQQVLKLEYFVFFDKSQGWA